MASGGKGLVNLRQFYRALRNVCRKKTKQAARQTLTPQGIPCKMHAA
jgi:hypothetical protein